MIVGLFTGWWTVVGIAAGFLVGGVCLMFAGRRGFAVGVFFCLAAAELVAMNALWGRPVGARVLVGIVLVGFALLILWNVAQTAPQEQAEPISDDHRHELQAIARGLRSRLPLERHAVYAPEGAAGTTPLAVSFRSHFSDVATALDELNVLVREIAVARHALWAWWNDEITARAIERGPIVFVVSGIAEATTPESQPSGFDWVEVLGWLQANGSPVVAAEAPDAAERTAALDGLLVDALDSDECGDLRRLRGEVEKARRSLSRELERVASLHVVRSRCDLCR